MRFISDLNQITAMHVCYFTPGRQGGYETRVIEEISFLTASGVDVVMACFINSPPLPPSAAKEFRRQLEQLTGATIYILPTARFFDMDGDSEICAALVKLVRRHKVDIIHGQALYSTMHIIRCRQELPTKVVFDVHGISPEETALAGGHSSRINRLTVWEKQALAVADLSIFVSGRMKEHFRAKYNWSEFLNCIVPCGVKTENFVTSDDSRIEKRRRAGFEQKFVIMYLGTLSVWQWPEAMFSLFAQFYRERSDSLLYLLLPASDHHKALSMIEKHGLSSASYRLEEVPHAEVGSIIEVADAGLLLREQTAVNSVSSPTKFGEYLAAGVPVISTEYVGDTSDLIFQENVGLVVDPTSEGSPAGNLNRLFAFADGVTADRSAWAKRCRATAEKHLGWNLCGQRLVESYRELVKDRPTVLSRKRRRSKKLLITIDVEAHPSRQTADPIESLVWGRFGKDQVGIATMMDLAERHESRLTFFLDYCEVGQYPGAFETISKSVANRGHDLQLHAHAEFLTDKFWQDRGLRPTKGSTSDYSKEYAEALTEFLVECAWGMGRRRPTAFRGGGFRYNDQMLKAMDSHGLTLSFNYNVDSPHQLNNEENLPMFRWSNGIVEVPTSAISFGGHLKNFDLRSNSGVDFGQVKAIHECMENYYREFEGSPLVMVLHSWSFLYLNKDTGHYEHRDEKLVKDFEMFLEKLPADVEVITASELNELVKAGKMKTQLVRDIELVNASKHVPPQRRPKAKTPAPRNNQQVWEAQPIADLVRYALPKGAVVAVISKGDENITKLNGCHGWHFPQTSDGRYAGYHPRDSASAIAHLEEIRVRGADFLLIPSTSFWWLDYYKEFNDYLNQHYRVVLLDELCAVFALTRTGAVRQS